MRIKQLIVASGLAFSLVAPAVTVHAQTAPACQFVLGFRALHDLDSPDIGDCIDNQISASNGDAQQHTTKGLMAWRKADNWTAFTNGYKTWINGPNGLVSRLNSDRFPWEAPAPATPPASAATDQPSSPDNPLSPNQIASIDVPPGYPAMSELPVSSQIACFHVAQALQAAGNGKVQAPADMVLCPDQDYGMWPGFKQS
jgi:hypothetical protein